MSKSEDKRNGIDAKGLFILAKSYNALKMERESIKIYKIILELDHKNIHARLELGKLYASQGKKGEAEPLFKECIELNQKDAYARLELKKLVGENSIEKLNASQDKDFEKLFKKNMDNPETSLERARKLIYDSEDVFESSKEIIRIISEESDPTIKILVEAEIATKIGLKQKAEVILKAYKKVNSSEPATLSVIKSS